MGLKHLVHPSNRLYHGECTDFRDAIETYIAALQYEGDLFTDEDDFNRESKTLFDRCIADAREALRQYIASVGEVERGLFAQFAASENENLRLIGEAALDGDYNRLAI